MPWIQLSTTTDPAHAEVVEDLFLTRSAVSVTLMDAADTPILEPEPGTTPIWNETRVMALFPAETDTRVLLNSLQREIGDSQELANLQIKTEILEDKDWEREWMKNFHPIQCGERLWICPSWREPPEPDRVNLLLDPGLAFGTGTHPTTFLCLQWLDGIDTRGKTVIDYGCGSGILAIAALLLGADSAVGIDIDPQALLASKDNSKRNGIPENKLSVFTPGQLQGSGTPPLKQADIVLANILAQPLIDLAAEIASHVKPGGRIALSGIIEKQAKPVENIYREWFDLEPVKTRDEWVLIVGKKHDLR
ncbi:MAG: 50S ribosomal protein L11 methyltransferase [Proteobacteria bacterium]|nr:MAG: 50S ribosomal protein L11 methyltransferase [Pseudomonadota bacterium]PIE40506.1 MAG: 50S ribosomal protein L11 methyltransferase [Gammaproteobacteria bacterium]